MPENARAGRAPARLLPPILGLLLVAALGAGAIAVQARAQTPPPPQLSEEELLSRITTAPENAPNFEATATFEQTLIPEGLLSASEGDGRSDSSGPRTVRVWRGGPEKFRAELQGENGDKVLVRNGQEIRVYDGATNTLKTGEKPEESSDAPEQAASPERIDEFLSKISPTSDLRTGPPLEFAGRWAYPLTLEPKDKNLTLVDRAEAYVDAEAFVPLAFELYAEGTPEPVVRYEASDFEVGPVPDDRFELEAPPGAEVVPLGSRDDNDRAEVREVKKVASVAEAQELVNFPVKQLAEAPGGRELTEVRVAGSEAVVQTYGSGWGTVVLTQRPERTDEPRDEASKDQTESGREELQVPTVDLGGGAEAKEISTPIGTSLSWSADGVSYSLAGSVPAAELEEVGRGLLSS